MKLLNENWVKTEIKKEKKNFLELRELKHYTPNLWETMKAVLGTRAYSTKFLHQKTRENS